MPRKTHALLLVGRDDWQKDEVLNQKLLTRLRKVPIDTHWEDPAGAAIYRLRQFEYKIKGLPKCVKKLNLRLTQLCYALVHPSYFIYLFRRRKQAIDIRCAYLERRIRELGIADCVTILSRSSGGRVSSLIADKMALRQIICLGYPFKHPEKPDEPERYLHLATINTPMLIIQGAQDEYGGLDVPERYMLSPRVELSFFDTDHNFNIDDQKADSIVGQIIRIVCSPKLRP
jgi:hypothetical protein